MRNFRHLTALPEELTVDRDLHIIGCTGITALPEQLTVRGSLYLNGCTGITALTEHLTVHGDLDLRDCTGITALPEQLTVRGSLYLNGCTGITALTEHLTVHGDLDLRDCTGITALPEQLAVRGSLYLNGCTGITALPEKLAVRDSLYLNGCTGITVLPEQLAVRGSLYLNGCTGITALPEQLEVRGSLYLNGCTGITALPEQLAVRGSLYLNGCTGITALPEQLTVHGALDLRGCTGIIALPEQLVVRGSLYLNGCTGITALPEQLMVGGNLYLNSCRNITSLPQTIATWGCLANGYLRIIDITGTGISAQTRERIAAQNIQGIQFQFDMVVEVEHFLQNEIPETLNAIVSCWKAEPGFDISPHEISAQNFGLNEYSERRLAQFLSRLFNTAEYNNIKARPSLAKRVSGLLLNIRLDRTLQEMCSALIEEALDSCGDRVALQMNKIELAVKIHNIQKDGSNPKDLEGLGLGLLKLEIVHKHAANTCRRLSMVDEIEVYLAYEVKLRELLNLPVSTNHMLYEQCAGVTDRELEAAAFAANRAVQPGAEERLAFFEGWEPWQKKIRQQAVANYSYVQLHPGRIDPNNDRICPFTQEPIGNLREPVLIGSLKTARVYESEAFITWWKEHGKEPAPAPQNQVSLNDLWRPMKKE